MPSAGWATSPLLSLLSLLFLFVYRHDGELIDQVKTGCKITDIKFGANDYANYSEEWNITDETARFFHDLLFILTGDRRILVYDIDKKNMSDTIKGYARTIVSFLIAPSQNIYIAYEDGAVQRYNCLTKKCEIIVSPENGCRSIALSEEQNLFCVSGESDTRARIFNYHEGTFVKDVFHDNSILFSFSKKINTNLQLFNSYKYIRNKILVQFYPLNP